MNGQLTTRKEAMKIKMTLTFKLVEGDPLQADAVMSAEDNLIDAFAATFSKGNGAKTPLRVAVWTDVENEKQSVYELDLVD